MNYTYFVDLGSWFFISFVVFLVIGSILSNVIGWLNSEKFDAKDRLSRIHALGELAKKLFSTRKVNKAMRYKVVSDGFSDMVGTIRSGISTLVVIFGILPFSISVFHRILPDGTRILWGWILASVVAMFASALFSAPFEYYRDFVIEKQFGFNSKTRKTFFSDMAKSLAIGSVLLVAIQYLMDFVLTRWFENISLSSVLAVVVFLVFLGKAMQLLFTSVILPMFNDFKPLKDRKLLKKIETLCARCGFKASSIEVMDASKRSTHSNAFICGTLGKKRIVLFDTILKNMTDDEIVAVIAHEIGHGKLHHLLFKNIEIVFDVAIGTVLALLLMKNPGFYSAFGYSWVTKGNVVENYVIGFSLANTFIGAFSWMFEPFSNWLSRKMEYAADRFAVSHIGNGKNLETALLKLASENLSDVIPHPTYEFLNYSHPSILNRILAIRKHDLAMETEPSGGRR